MASSTEQAALAAIIAPASGTRQPPVSVDWFKGQPGAKGLKPGQIKAAVAAYHALPDTPQGRGLKAGMRKRMMGTAQAIAAQAADTRSKASKASASKATPRKASKASGKASKATPRKRASKASK